MCRWFLQTPGTTREVDPPAPSPVTGPEVYAVQIAGGSYCDCRVGNDSSKKSCYMADVKNEVAPPDTNGPPLDLIPDAQTSSRRDPVSFESESLM